MSTMKAIGVYQPGKPEVLELVEVAKPTPGDEDLLVKISAFAVNPIDTKMRLGGGYGSAAPGTARILGWDASGVVEAVGSGVKGYAVGDEVYFAGSLFRPGSNAEYTAVDYRLVAAKPKTVEHVVAASMPLTLVTAWEAIEHKFQIRIPQAGSDEEKLNASKTMLIVAGAGGVGSIAIQLAKRIFKIGKVVATAGRADSQAWCLKLGADLILDRSKDYETQLKEAGIAGFDYIFSCTAIDDILENLISILNPFGHIASIVNAQKPLALQNLFRKIGSLSFEFMGGRPLHKFGQEVHGDILARGAALIDNGTLVPWVGTTFDSASVENLRAAHALQETGTAIGKITLVAKF